MRLKYKVRAIYRLQIMFINYEKIDETNLNRLSLCENLLVYIIRDINEDDIFSRLSNINPSLSHRTKMFSYGYSNVYFLE